MSEGRSTTGKAGNSKPGCGACESGKLSRSWQQGSGSSLSLWHSEQHFSASPGLETISFRSSKQTRVGTAATGRMIPKQTSNPAAMTLHTPFKSHGSARRSRERFPGDALFTDSPSVILEVLSPNTRRIDEVQKFRDYITFPTLGTYILAETDSPVLTLHRRDGAGFHRKNISGLDAILDLPEAGINVPLAELYRDVE